MRFEFNVGVPDGLVRVLRVLRHRAVLLGLATAVAVLGSVSAWAISAFTPFQPDTVISASQVNAAFQALYESVAKLEAKAPEVPAGTIVAFAGSVAPDGWLICDGRSLSKKDQSALFDAIGTSHGGDGAPMFNIPDLRGRFLRGVDQGAGRDPDAANRTRPQLSSGNSGDSVGSLQSGGTALPVTAFNTNIAGAHTHTVLGFNAATYSPGLGVTVGGVQASVEGTIPSAGDHAHSIVSGGDAETRPVNININWIIKL